MSRPDNNCRTPPFFGELEADDSASDSSMDMLPSRFAQVQIEKRASTGGPMDSASDSEEPSFEEMPVRKKHKKTVQWAQNITETQTFEKYDVEFVYNSDDDIDQSEYEGKASSVASAPGPASKHNLPASKHNPGMVSPDQLVSISDDSDNNEAAANTTGSSPQTRKRTYSALSDSENEDDGTNNTSQFDSISNRSGAPAILNPNKSSQVQTRRLRAHSEVSDSEDEDEGGRNLPHGRSSSSDSNKSKSKKSGKPESRRTNSDGSFWASKMREKAQRIRGGEPNSAPKSGPGRSRSQSASPKSPSRSQLGSRISPSRSVSKSGWMRKTGGNGMMGTMFGSVFNERFFELERGVLKYYKKQGGKERGRILLSKLSRIRAETCRANTFSISSIEHRRIYYFECQNNATVHAWLTAVKKAAGTHEPKPNTVPQMSPGVVPADQLLPVDHSSDDDASAIDNIPGDFKRQQSNLSDSEDD